ncbi:hypothetical protein apy_11230 [Aeropyrum pernix]|uniref:Uncharacterized protein n=1 Tax=Aeropyrum pernix TaxID=56636 RepID=A0A401HAL6_AERPX|nr:hypothetical protein [Aeropyrum pernix]GBF09398.1 hypothetical protein apy_11230 [Aeropyrum pernix]
MERVWPAALTAALCLVALAAVGVVYAVAAVASFEFKLLGPKLFNLASLAILSFAFIVSLAGSSVWAIARGSGASLGFALLSGFFLARAVRTAAIAYLVFSASFAGGARLGAGGLSLVIVLATILGALLLISGVLILARSSGSPISWWLWAAGTALLILSIVLGLTPRLLPSESMGRLIPLTSAASNLVSAAALAFYAGSILAASGGAGARE